ncbi:MAG TPA: cupredoxin domain-containing protein [Actinomycetota bacterium]|nr:cupredoxin domain-containing protein [Actinomycetota bacterium]
MRRGMLLCTIVVLAAVVGMPGVASAGGGCHGGVTQNDATGEEDATIEMVDACFTATVTTVDPGTPVTFVNMDEFVHNVGGNQWGHFDDLHEADTFRVSFDEAGTYPFACSYHPGMTGAIVVGDGKGAGNGAGIAVGPFEAPRPETVTRVVTASGGVSAASVAVAAIVGGLLGAAITVGLTRSASRKVPARLREPV